MTRPSPQDTRGIRAVRDRNVQVLEAWLATKTSDAARRQEALEEALGLGPSEGWPEGAGRLLASLQRKRHANNDALRSFWTKLKSSGGTHGAPRGWRGTLESLALHAPPAWRADVLDGNAAAAFSIGEDDLGLSIAKTLKPSRSSLHIQDALVERNDPILLGQFLAQGHPLAVRVAVDIHASRPLEPLRTWLMAQPDWPGTPEGLFETAVISGLVVPAPSAPDQAHWLDRLVAWGLPKEGLLEISEAPAYIDALSSSRLPGRLHPLRARLRDEIPAPRPLLVMSQGRRTFVRLPWTQAWPEWAGKMLLDQTLPSTDLPRRKPRL